MISGKDKMGLGHFSSIWHPCRFWYHKQWHPSRLAQRIGNRIAQCCFTSFVKESISQDSDREERFFPWPLWYGMPQGLVLYPFQFNIYMRTLGKLICPCGVRYHQYDDDSQLYISSSGKLAKSLDILYWNQYCIVGIVFYLIVFWCWSLLVCMLAALEDVFYAFCFLPHFLLSLLNGVPGSKWLNVVYIYVSINGWFIWMPSF